MRPWNGLLVVSQRVLLTQKELKKKLRYRTRFDFPNPCSKIIQNGTTYKTGKIIRKKRHTYYASPGTSNFCHTTQKSNLTNGCENFARKIGEPQE